MNTTHLFSFIAAVMVVVVIYSVLLTRSYRKSAKYRVIRSAQESISDQSSEEKLSGLADVCRTMIRMVGVDPLAVRQQRYTELGRAGLLREGPLCVFLFVRWFIQPLCLLVAFTLVITVLTTKGFVLFSAGGFLRMLLVLVFGLLGVKLENLILSNLAHRRDRALYVGFADAVDLLMVCIEAGQSLDASLARICKELGRTHPVVTEELDRTRLELSLTADRTQALHNLAERTNTMGFRALVAALVQSEKYGTNLSDTLRILSDEFRNTRLLNAENKAASVGVKITLPLISCMLLPFLMLVMGPAIIRISKMM